MKITTIIPEREVESRIFETVLNWDSMTITHWMQRDGKNVSEALPLVEPPQAVKDWLNGEIGKALNVDLSKSDKSVFDKEELIKE